MWSLAMSVSYKKLWKKLIDVNMTKTQLREATNMGTTTLAKLGKDQPVKMETLLKICSVLDCDISDVCEFINE